MKLHYYPETKSLYIELAPGAAVDAVELGEGLVADIDSKGRVVGLDIDNSSSYVDLSSLETVEIPVLPTAS
ncbi:MAG: DUF2283 domain-containing protein [Dehalococcoidia bacterium]|jgi:uncharacterized protein YuzE|uniref:DUF2283 domain-containing protein n=1 Tax=Candidatus Amarobacter glycogenicus TaxID=3140699 RepID=UPI001D647FF7|nr:DUF2283 domain-containing protein [Dehalococcoidia bacterium]MBK6562590.1 DUF2283 domain-containing protein [Dehalococcoidia bacterium]MBK7127635.1 DUF2283 domain-containing protein [Dehalococcoidia bacterium]MBK7329501.1 DUF2283 domain-containing protein [Dehalococcoidia bacterium]MBK7725744.1 DUF2283 domain-containing protein [Dehalococcoidia bacterium]